MPVLLLLLLRSVAAAGSDEEAEAAALEVCKEAEIIAIVRDSQPAAPPVYLDSSPKSFLRCVEVLVVWFALCAVLE
jgi:hypothetical protein